MNQSIMDGMNSLFDKLEYFSNAFNKKTYDDTFLKEYDNYKPMFKDIIAEYEAAEDKETFVNEVSAIVPKRMHAELAQLPNKRKVEQYLMNHNMGMVTYVIPMFYYGRNEILDLVANRMIEMWNDHNVEMKISGTTFEDLKDGFKFHLCYITTAVCEGLGREDDCYELNLLRDYRDQYLVKTEEGSALVQCYYDIAPTIVKRISRDEHADEIYKDLWNEYLHPCVSMIEEGQMEECRGKYTDMVHTLQKKYLYS